MCGIAGFAGRGAWQRTCEMTELLHHRGPDGSAIYDGREACLGHTHLKVTGDYPQPAMADGRVFVFNGEVYNYRAFADVTSDTEALARILSGGMERLVDTAPSIDGDYSLGLWDGTRLSLIRDPIGVKPLYYGRSADGFGFASERKALWRAGVRDVKALSPGAMLADASASADGEERRVVDLPPYDPVMDEEEAIRTLDEALSAAVRARVHKEAAVNFSGGVDSALVGALAPGVPLVTVGLAGSHDVKAARQAAKLMGTESRLIVYEITDKDVEDATAGTVYAVESADPVKISIALPLYLLAQKARNDGCRVLLSGQGADELFGGYARYEKAFEDERLEKELDHDLRHIADINLERDDMATMAHGVELRVPFLDMRVVTAARRMGPSLKVRRNGKDYIRKYVLRKVAEKYLPTEVASAPKKAIQYGTGVQKTLERQARSKGSTLAGYLESLYRNVFR
jgi:asparagine synthase (glutamine-hydrolysing)